MAEYRTLVLLIIWFVFWISRKKGYIDFYSSTAKKIVSLKKLNEMLAKISDTTTPACFGIDRMRCFQPFVLKFRLLSREAVFEEETRIPIVSLL